MRTLTFFLIVLLAIGNVSLLLSASGCAGAGQNQSSGRSPNSDVSREAQEVFGTPSSRQGVAGQPQTWAIALALVPAEDEAAARQMLADVRTRGGVPDARLEKRGKAYVAAYGAYETPKDPAAKADLARLRAMFPGAMLMPPDSPGWTPSNPEYDLSTVKQRLGKGAMYTLQVAVYERSDGREPTPEDLAEIRRAAEAAAAQLRRDGDEAFFYHGPRRSMVTVGVFGEKDIRMGPMSGESPVLRALREKYPYNLVNGATIKVKTRANPEGSLQSSFVVAIPD